MKRFIRNTTRAVLFLALGIVGASVVLHAPRAYASAASPFDPAAEKDTSKTITGTVVGSNEAPLSDAVVYIKNTKTLAVKSYITDDAGGFRFLALSPNVDYELHAEFNGQRSSTRTISAFDPKTNVSITLKINTKK